MDKRSDPARQEWVRLLVFRWVARAWSIPAILFVGAHLVPSGNETEVEVHWFTWVTVGVMFLSVFSLALAWWLERIGGWASLGLLGLFFILYAIDRGEFFPVWWLQLAFVGGPAAMFLVTDHFKRDFTQKEKPGE